MKKLNIYFAIFIGALLIGCSNGSDDSNSSVSAPSSISGKSINITVTSGSGGFATTGTATFVVSNSVNQYTITGDLINVANSAGTYTYSANGNKGTIAFDDSALGNGNFYLTFTTESSGNYTADIAISASATQSGTFQVQ